MDETSLNNPLSTAEEDWELEKSIPPAKLRAVNLYLTGSYTYNQIGKIIGVTGSTISKWLKSEDVINVMSKVQERELELSRLELNNLRHKAIGTMEDLLNSTMEQVRLGAAKDILDRTGLKAVQEKRIEQNVTTTTHVKSSLEELADLFIDAEDAEVIEDE